MMYDNLIKLIKIAKLDVIFKALVFLIYTFYMYLFALSCISGSSDMLNDIFFINKNVKLFFTPVASFIDILLISSSVIMIFTILFGNIHLKNLFIKFGRLLNRKAILRRFFDFFIIYCYLSFSITFLLGIETSHKFHQLYIFNYNIFDFLFRFYNDNIFLCGVVWFPVTHLILILKLKLLNLYTLSDTSDASAFQINRRKIFFGELAEMMLVGCIMGTGFFLVPIIYIPQIAKSNFAIISLSILSLIVFWSVVYSVEIFFRGKISDIIILDNMIELSRDLYFSINNRKLEPVDIDISKVRKIEYYPGLIILLINNKTKIFYHTFICCTLIDKMKEIIAKSNAEVGWNLKWNLVLDERIEAWLSRRNLKV